VVAALDALTVAQSVFGRVGMHLEYAKATNMLGAAQRAAGHGNDAVASFVDASAGFAALGQPVEDAAASYNLGLARQEVGDVGGARAAWTRAQQLFLDAGLPAQASAAARAHGVSLLNAGDGAARPHLEEALELAERAGDAVALGAAANALGLSLLMIGDPTGAIVAFGRALGGFPYNLRPAEHAMVKVNLALAYEHAGEEARARLLARQGLAMRAAAPPVRMQAREILGRLAAGEGQDLLTVLDSEPVLRWSLVMREEVLRWDELPRNERLRAVGDFVDGLLDRPAAAYDLAASVLSVMLELPPKDYEEMASALVQASDNRSEAQTARVQAVFRSAMARFPVPQWQRLAATFDAAAAQAGQRAVWR